MSNPAKISKVCYDKYSNIIEKLRRNRTDVENNMVDWGNIKYEDHPLDD